ncbi:hypothetical protein HPP92_021092, partial [Vanilla planifolia]
MLLFGLLLELVPSELIGRGFVLATGTLVRVVDLAIGRRLRWRLYFPGCDYEHWLIVMDKPGGENATKEQMIDCYIKTLANVVRE